MALFKAHAVIDNRLGEAHESYMQTVDMWRCAHNNVELNANRQTAAADAASVLDFRDDAEDEIFDGDGLPNIHHPLFRLLMEDSSGEDIETTAGQNVNFTKKFF